MFRNMAYIQFCLLVAASGTADVAGHVPVTTEDEPIACPIGMGALRKALASVDLKDPSRLVDLAVSSFLPDLMALLAAALFFYFLNLVLVVPKRRSKPRTEPLEDSEDESQSQVPEISGCTALHLAAHNGCARELGALIDSGLDVNAVDNYNETALHMAARVGRVDICSMLLEAGADPEVQNKHMKTAFLIAAISGHSEVCDLLRPSRKTRKTVARKEKLMPKQELDEDMLSDESTEFSDLYQPSEEGGFGASELHDAALMSSLGQVLALLRRGAEVNRCDPWGETALHMAARVGSLEICAALCAARADPTMRNKDNNSALDVANVSQNQDICKLLQDFS